MYSDTHFHFKSLREDEEWTRASVLKKMAESGVKFALDIGTDCDVKMVNVDFHTF